MNKSLDKILKDYDITMLFFTDDNCTENNPTELIKSVSISTKRGHYTCKLANSCVSEEGAAWQALMTFIHDKIQ